MKDSKKKSWFRGRRLALSLIFALAVLFVFFIFSLPIAIRWVGQSYLRKVGKKTATIKGVDLNLFTGELGIRLVTGGKKDETPLQIGGAALQADWWPLWKKRLVLHGFSLDDVDLDIRQDTSGTLLIGGLNFLSPATSTTLPPTPTPKSPPPSVWGIRVGTIDMRNVRITYNNPDVHADILIESMHVNPIDSAIPEVPVPFDAAMVVNGGRIVLRGSIRPFAQDPQGSVALHLGNFPLGWLAEILRHQGIAGVDGVVNIDTIIKGVYRPKAGTKNIDLNGTLSLEKLRGQTPDVQLHEGSFGWKGTLRFDGAVSTVSLSLAGGINTKGVRVSLTSQGLDVGEANLGWQGGLTYRSGLNAEMALSGLVKGDGLVVHDRAKNLNLVELGSVELRDTLLQMPLGTAGGAIRLSGGLSLAKLQAQLVEQGIGLAQSDFSWTGALQLGSGNQPTSLTGNIALNGLMVRDLKKQSDLAQLDGLVLKEMLFESPEGFAAGKMKLRVGLEAKGIQAHLMAQNLAVSQSAFGWEGEFSLGEKKKGEIELTGNLSGNGLMVKDLEKKLNLLELDEFSLNKAQLAGTDKIEADQIRFSGVRMLARAPAERKAQGGPPFILSLKELSLTKPDMNGKDIAAKSVRLAGIDSFLVLGPKGDLQYGLWTPPLAKEEPKPVANQKTASKTKAKVKRQAPEKVKEEEIKLPVSARVDQFEIGGVNHIVFRDESVRPATNISVQSLTLLVEQFNTETPEKLMPVKLQARLGKYSDINFQGSLAPLASKPAADLKGKIVSIDLPPFTSYSEKQIGYRLRTGVLGVDTSVNLKGGIIDSTTKVSLSKFNLERLKKDELDEFTKQLGLPVNTALALLRDRNDNINLTIPIKGDLRDPKVGGIAGIIRKALLNAVTMGVRALVAPLGMTVQIGSKLVLRNNAFAFNPVVFAPGQDDLSTETITYLDKMAGMLNERPGISLRIGGMTTPMDVRALQGEVVETLAKQEAAQKKKGIERLKFWKKKPTPTPVVIPPGQTGPVIPQEQLQGLARRREGVVKDYLVKKGIDPARLFLNAPTVEKEGEGKPRVDLGILK